jgi:serine/threonine-protein kinase
MKKAMILISIIMICIFAGGCSGIHTKGTDAPAGIALGTQPADNTKASPTPSVSPAAQQVSYIIYKNERFQFSIEYPDTFVTKMLPENGDGIILASPDGNTELTISGINNVIEVTPLSLFNDLVKIHNPSYKKQQGNWFVASWAEGDMIVYEKCVVGTGSENTFIIKYPSSQKQAYDSIVEHLSSTFKTPSVNESH